MNRFLFEPAAVKIMELSPIPFIVYKIENKRPKTYIVSEGFCETTGIPRKDVIFLQDNDPFRDMHPDDIRRVSNAFEDFLAGKSGYNVVYRVKDLRIGKYVVVHAHGKTITNADGRRALMIWYSLEDVSSNITDDEKEVTLKSDLIELLHAESLIHETYYDGLTGLPNMGFFLRLADEGMEKIRNEGEVPAVIFLDLTGMKFFNRKYGLAEGDNLLRAVAEILKEHFGNENCGRLGRDHFAVFSYADGLEKIIRTIFVEMKRANGGKTIPLRVGIYEDKYERVSASEACDRANLAADSDKGEYVSKIIYYDEKIRKLSLTKEYVLNNFDNALKNNWIRPYYQQIVRAVTGRVCDEEALARWIDPERGLITPDQFIPVLEDAKLIYKLDLHIVDCVLKDIKRRQAAGIDVVPVSINISRYDLQLCDMIKEICKRVDKAGIPRNMITLEITESVSGVDPELLVDQVKKFHNEGFKVWMDDFGSGYSSLTVLQNFDFDLIKFDMRFMREFNSSEKNPIILTALMQMATKLGIDTIAEGVETEEQIKFLKEIGCNKLQGYYFNRPNPTDVVIDNYRNGTGVTFENRPESGYFEVISKASLSEPSITVDEYGEAVNEYFNAVPMGVLEYSEGQYYVLRYNKTYEDFLIKLGLAKPEMLRGKNNKVPFLFDPEAKFTEAVKLTKETGQWVSVKNGCENGISIRAYVKKIAENPVNGAVAVIVVILSTSAEAK